MLPSALSLYHHQCLETCLSLLCSVACLHQYYISILCFQIIIQYCVDSLAFCTVCMHTPEVDHKYIHTDVMYILSSKSCLLCIIYQGSRTWTYRCGHISQHFDDGGSHVRVSIGQLYHGCILGLIQAPFVELWCKFCYQNELHYHEDHSL